MQTARQQVPPALSNFDILPDSAMVNVKTVAAVLGRSESSCWRDVRAGKLPKPVKAGPACTRWKVGAIRSHLASLEVSA